MDSLDLRASRYSQAREIYLHDEDTSAQRGVPRSWSASDFLRNFASGDFLEGLPVKRIAGASALLLLFWTLHPFVFSQKFPARQEVVNARNLISGRWKGLAADFVRQELPKGDIRPRNPGVPEAERTLDQDFRQIEVARDTPALDGYYRGTSCLVHYPGSICPFPHQCPTAAPASEGERSVQENGPCLHWRTGTLSSVPDLSAATISTGRDRLLRIDDQWDRNGTWSDADTWLPAKMTSHQSRSWRFFTPQDTARCLAGKRILVQGDSMMRQFYNRIIHYMRGIPAYSEKYYGGLSSYTVFANGTDEWQLPREDGVDAFSRTRDIEEQVVFRVLYDWQAEKIDDITASFQAIIERDVDIAVLGFNYWYPLGFDFSRLPRTIDDFYSRNPSWQGILSWYSAPQEFKDKDSWWHVGQGALMRHLAADRRWREKRNFHTLPSDMMVAAADAKGYPQRNCRFDNTPDVHDCLHDAHFGAGVQSIFGTPTLPGIMGFKAPKGLYAMFICPPPILIHLAGYDGRDMYNLGVLQVWLNSICP